MTDKVYVATYGSLRTGLHNFRINERAGGVSIGEGYTDHPYLLSQYGGAYFPVVSLEQKGEHSVRIEVFETTQDGLEGPYDSLEGYPSFYNRTLVPVTLDDGRTLDAWIYHIEGERCHGEQVKSGDWKDFPPIRDYLERSIND